MKLIETESRTIRIACDAPVVVWQRFLEIVNRCGLTVLTSVKHDFPGCGLTGVVVLGESHAAIHTWPEHGVAWIELATCGSGDAIDRFRSLIEEWENETNARQTKAEVGGY